MSDSPPTFPQLIAMMKMRDALHANIFGTLFGETFADAYRIRLHEIDMMAREQVT